MFNVIFASDDNYAPLLGVALYSLLENNCNDFDQIQINIFDGGITEGSKSKIQQICDEFEVVTILKFIDYNNIDEVIGIDVASTRALSTYARLFTSSLLDNELDKVLYLDCDAIISGSFKELWELNIDGYDCAAVLDVGPDYVKSFIGMDVDLDYFNAGMLLINLNKWREDNLEEKYLKFLIKNNGNVFHNDQGIINAVSHNNILKIHPKYNALGPFFDVPYQKVLDFYQLNKLYDVDEIIEAIKNPVFIHLTTFVHGRVWFTNAEDHPLREKFDYFVQKTPFKNEVYMEDNRGFNGKFLSFCYNMIPFWLICWMFGIYRILKIKILN